MKQIIPIERSLAPVQSALLHVKWEEALRVTPLINSIATCADSGKRQLIAARSGDLATLGFQITDIVASRGDLIVSFSQKGAALLKSGELRLMKDASGTFIPKLLNSSGKIVESGRAVKSAAQLTRLAANLAASVITAAHIISGADLSKKLDRVGNKVDFLVAARRISQMSRLEGIFRHARELAHLSDGDYTRQQNHMMGRELFELRSEWRSELVYRLENIHRPEEGNWLTAWFHSLARKSKDKKNSQDISRSEAEIGLLDVSLAMHTALAQGAGTLDVFLSVSLPDELEAIHHARDLLWEKRDIIREKHSDSRGTVLATVDRFDEVLDRFKAFAMPKIPTILEIATTTPLRKKTTATRSPKPKSRANAAKVSKRNRR